MRGIVVGQGRNGAVAAWRDSKSVLERFNHLEENNHGGLEGWKAIKIVSAPPNGRLRSMRPHDVVKEALVLKALECPYIARLLKYMYDTELFEHHLYLPLFAMSLADLLRDHLFPSTFTSTVVTYQLLSALSYLSQRGVSHRDINPSNLLVDFRGNLKLVDFGTVYLLSPRNYEAVQQQENKDDMCCEVGTASYRAPELLFSSFKYDAQAVDLWAAGCVIAQLFRPFTYLPTSPPVRIDERDQKDPFEAHIRPQKEPGSVKEEGERQPLFDATFGSLGLAASIFKIRGTPTDDNWPDFTCLPDAGKISFPTSTPIPLSSSHLLPGLNALAGHADDATNVIDGLLQLDPKKRRLAQDVLKNDWLTKTDTYDDPCLVKWVERAKEVYNGIDRQGGNYASAVF
nr:CMGC/CDK protein kinase [Cryptococcus depauperatus CBS 7841]